jgi:hypothetical protein
LVSRAAAGHCARGWGFGTPGFEVDAPGLAELLEHHERLVGWLDAAGETLRYDVNGLTTVEGLIDLWNADADISPALGNELGTFFGTVMVKEVDGASWHVWPNGHPVVRLMSSRDIDVVDLVARRIASGHPTLLGVLMKAKGH